MGRLTIGTDAITFDDHTLAHLDAVIATKLRRQEPFSFTWVIDASFGSGRVSRWISPATNWSVRYDDRYPAALNPAWLQQLMKAANSPEGLRVIPEPADRPSEGRAGSATAADPR